MEDGIKFIFKTLIKIPIVIFVAYLIFNLFSFTVAYFRLYSLAQMVNSVVMENNFIPGNSTDTLTDKTLYGQINEYKQKNVETALLVNPTISVETKDNSGTHENKRVQYGGTAEVSVKATFVWLNPLLNIASADGQQELLNDIGVNETGTGGGDSSIDIEDQLNIRGFGNSYDPTTGVRINKYNADKINKGANTEIVFNYSVPCMKYYSDLAE